MHDSFAQGRMVPTLCFSYNRSHFFGVFTAGPWILSSKKRHRRRYRKQFLGVLILKPSQPTIFFFSFFWFPFKDAEIRNGFSLFFETRYTANFKQATVKTNHGVGRALIRAQLFVVVVTVIGPSSSSLLLPRRRHRYCPVVVPTAAAEPARLIRLIILLLLIVILLDRTTPPPDRYPRAFSTYHLLLPPP